MNPVKWWASINKKVEHFNKVEAKYVALEKEHAHLKAEYFRLEHEYLSLQSQVSSKELASASLKATGSKEGRSLASINYEVPKNLKPEELLALAYEHLREQRFMQAAKTFETMLSLPESSALHSSGVFYSTGVAWFQVQNFSKAKENFELARGQAEGEEKEKINRKVELWMRVIDRKLASTEKH